MIETNNRQKMREERIKLFTSIGYSYKEACYLVEKVPPPLPKKQEKLNIQMINKFWEICKFHGGIGDEFKDS